MGLGTDTTYSIGEQGHFLDRPAHTKAFESPQLRNLEVCIGDLALFIEKDLDFAMTF
jgi:hypothetical protein